MKLEIHHKGQLLGTKDLVEGTYKIGRISDNDIQLNSGEVSKRHALIVVKGNKAAVLDNGSANGVFVNGILVKKQRIREGDEIVIADYHLKIDPRKSTKAPKIELETPMEPLAMDMGNLAPDLDVASVPEPDEDLEPELSPQERVLVLMDNKILAPLYGMMKRFDWRVLLSIILIGTLVLSVLLSVVPIFRWGKSIATREALNRAHTVLNQVVRENYRILVKTNDYTRLNVEAAESEQGILSCLVVDPKAKTVYSPASLFNKTIVNIYSIMAIDKIVKGKQDVVSVDRHDGTYTVAQPIYIFSQEKNDRVLSAVVLATFEVPAGVYATLEPLVEAALFSILLSLIAYFVIMKMVSYPIVKIQEQLDAALKGDDVTVSCETKFPELETLATEINFSISRWKQAGGGPGAIDAKDTESEDNNYLASVEEFDEGSSDAVLVLDPDKIVKFVSNAYEELMNMKSQFAIGQNITEACRDQSFAGTCIELADKVVNNFGESQFAQLDINGINREIVAVGHKNIAGDLTFILITVKLIA